MLSNRNIEVTIRQYLLGQLSGEAFEQFEERLFADDDLFAEMLAAEDDLIDASLAGELSRADSELFTSSFLNAPDRRQKLLFRQVLKSYIQQKNQRRRPAPTPARWWFSLTHSFRTAIASTAVIIIAVLVGVVPLVRHFTMQAPTFATINLTVRPSERSAGAEATKVKLPLAVDELRLQLTLPVTVTPAKNYRVELIRISGETRTIETVAQDEKSVTVAIPTSQLERGQFALNLYVTRPGEPEQRVAGSYYFTVE